VYIERRPLGGPGKAFKEMLITNGEPTFRRDAHLLLEDKIKTLKEQAQSAEKEAVKKMGRREGPYASVPTHERALRAESEEQNPKSISLFMTVRRGHSARGGDTGEGFHRGRGSTLRHEALPTPSPEGEGDEISPARGNFRPVGVSGKYSLRMLRMNGQVAELGSAQALRHRGGRGPMFHRISANRVHERRAHLYRA